MGQEIYLGNPPENVANFISAQYDAKRTTVSLTCHIYESEDLNVFLSSFYDIESYDVINLIKRTTGKDDPWEKYFYIEYDCVKIGNTVKRLDNCYLTSFTDRIIQIPDSVSAIGHNCFEYSGARINGISKSVVEIGEDAFNGSEYV